MVCNPGDPDLTILKGSDSARLSFEFYGGVWLRFVGKALEGPRESRLQS